MVVHLTTSSGVFEPVAPFTGSEGPGERGGVGCTLADEVEELSQPKRHQVSCLMKRNERVSRRHSRGSSARGGVDGAGEVLHSRLGTSTESLGRRLDCNETQ